MNCKSCNGEIAKGVNKCTHCGKDQRNFYMKHKFLSILLVLIFLGVIGSAINENNDTADTDTTIVEDDNSKEVTKNTKETTSEKTTNTETIDDFSDMAKEYTLTNGHYTAGIDLPAGRCNIVALSGQGNVTSSNIFNGGINEMFGVDDGTGYYSSSFNGMKMEDDVVLSVSGGVTIKVVYSKISGRYVGRELDKDKAFELTNGNYLAGTDFPAGIYNIEAISGQGNVSSSNIFEGGINEMFGIDDGSGFYAQSFKNLELKDNIELTISNGVTIKLIPVK